jgi:hypothetical protein
LGAAIYVGGMIACLKFEETGSITSWSTRDHLKNRPKM